MFSRWLCDCVLEALSDTPVVFIAGARQTGKSTLVRSLVDHRYLTFDDLTVLAAAQADPAGFVAKLGGPVVLDEIQRAPEILLAVKAAVDRDRAPGRFLLTGSAHPLVIPRLSEALVGRMELLVLRPLSQGELESRRECLLDALFAPEWPSLRAPASDTGVVERVLRGGFPEAVARTAPDRRDAWFASYLSTLVQRDVRDLANIDNVPALSRLLTLLASRSSCAINASENSRLLGLPLTTVRRHLSLLEATWMLEPLPAWSANVAKRLARAPKVFLCDSGLAAHLVGATPARMTADPTAFGPLLETFVVQELRKQAGWSRLRATFSHFRTQTGDEVDVVAEDAAGRVVGVEVKAGATLGANDFRGLRRLAELAGPRFHRGIVLYGGTETLPFGERFLAVPLGVLWSAAETGGA